MVVFVVVKAVAVNDIVVLVVGNVVIVVFGCCKCRRPCFGCY